MPGPEDPLRSALEDLATPADPAGAYERIVEKKIRRQIYRKVQIVGLVVAVLFGTVGGTFLLAKTFRGDPLQQAAREPLEQSSIVFFTNRNLPSKLDYTMYRMDPDGTHMKQVTTPPILTPRDRLSPDGSKIAYGEGISEGRGQIIVANVDGSDRRVLTRLDNPASPAWSPDGRTIAFYTGNGVDIYVIPAAGGTPIQLTHPPSDCADVDPSWSPDGSKIAFIRDCGDLRGFYDIYVMSADGTDLRLVTNHTLPILDPPLSWSPDGRHIAFVVRDPPTTFQIMVIAVDGSGLKRLTSEGDNATPTWSPDGKQIAFTSNRDGNEEIYVMNADGTRQRNLTHSPADERNPSWQPVPTATVEPSESPSPSVSTSMSPEPSVTAPSLPPILECATSLVLGDFDGDGLMDTAGVCEPELGTFSLQVAWGSGASGSVDLPDCQEECRAVAAADLDGDGSAEFILAVNQGASTEFLESFELPVSEVFARSAVTVAEPGAEGFPAGEPAVFPVDGSVTHLDFMTCDVGEDGKQQVIATSAVLNQEQTEYAVHETVLALHPDLDPPYGQFVVVSTTDSTFAFDPTGASQPQPRGHACWDEPPPPIPTPSA